MRTEAFEPTSAEALFDLNDFDGRHPSRYSSLVTRSVGHRSDALPWSLNYVEANHKTSLGYGFKQDGGNSCGDYTWFEGTSQVALAYLLAGNQGKWQSILDGVYSVQDASGGVPATDGPCLNIHAGRWQSLGIFSAHTRGGYRMVVSGRKCNQPVQR
jgi:hypothetical protein